MADDCSEIKESREDNLSVGAKGGAIAFTLKVGSAALAFLNQIILARFLGAGGVGEVLLALSLYRISSQIAKFGMEETLMRFVPLYIEQKDDARLKGTIYFAIKFCLMMSIVFILLILLLSRFISISIFHSTMLLTLLPVIAIALPAGVIREIIGGVLKGYKDTYRALLPESFVAPTVRIGVFLFLTFKGISPLYAVIAFVTGEILALLLSLKFLSKRMAEIRSVKKQCENKRILKVAYTIIFASMSMYLFTQTDLWVLGILMSTKAVGIYGIAAKLVFLVYFPMFALGAIIPPIFSSTHASGNREELKRVTHESTRWILSMSMPIVLVLILEGRFILRYFYGLEFEAGYSVLLMLTAAHLISAGTGLVGLFLQMTGQHKVYMKLNILFGLLNVVLNIILVMRFGIFGAAMATAFCMASLEVTCTYIINKRFSILSLAKGFTFDICFIVIVSVLYLLIIYAGIYWGPHLLLVVSLTVYLWKS
ncbi:MAG: oligosaccharide flippase family protein, partial [Thermodesulfovibrionia bacterium]|nr:oligosaccharide flippase family protein [Thermodesulfovibrionia bacterium]